MWADVSKTHQFNMYEQIECVTHLTTMQPLDLECVILKKLLELDCFKKVSFINQFKEILDSLVKHHADARIKLD